MHIVVSGVTGVGKTTWAKALVEHVNGKFLGERVESAALFRLANFHPSRRDLRLLAQIRFLMSAADGHADASLSPLPYFQDHSVYEVAEIYTARLAERGDLDDTGLSVLNSLYATIQTELPAPGVVLHLLADPSTIQSRLRERNRDSDESLGLGEISLLTESRFQLWKRLAVPVVPIDTSLIERPIGGSPQVAEVWSMLKIASHSDEAVE